MRGRRTPRRISPAVALAVAVAVAAGCGLGVGLALARSPARLRHSALRAQFRWAPREKRAPSFTLVDQASRPLSLRALRGRVVLVTFLDSRCRLMCPLEARLLRAAADRLTPAARPTVLVVSVDPWKDTPRSERAFASRSHWSMPWYWVNGSLPALRRVWREYAIGVQPTTRDITHSTGVYLLDRAGYERGGYLIPFRPADLAHDVRMLAAS